MNDNPFQTPQSSASGAKDGGVKHAVLQVVVLHVVFTLANVLLMFFVAPLFSDLLIEFGVEMPGLSMLAYTTCKHWQYTTLLMVAYVVCTTHAYLPTTAPRSSYHRRTWYLTVAGWIVYTSAITVGVSIPLINLLMGL